LLPDLEAEEGDRHRLREVLCHFSRIATLVK